eukprot:SAG11_NODE_14743_length_601_cov_0.842629_2_plen_76_part_01
MQGNRLPAALDWQGLDLLLIRGRGILQRRDLLVTHLHAVQLPVAAPMVRRQQRGDLASLLEPMSCDFFFMNAVCFF